MTKEFNELRKKLDKFIRKYYKNQIFRGLLLSLILYAAFYLVVSFLEYYGHFSIPVRTTLFYGTLTLFIFILIRNIIIPLTKYFHIGKIISYKQASNILSKHFPELQDKLFNTLELAETKQEKGISHDLLLACIDQRIQKMKPIPFVAAVNFRDNLKYLRYLIPLLLLLLLIYGFYPAFLTESNERIIKHRTYFEPKAPFEFQLLNDSLKVQKGSDFKVKVQMSGKYVPQDVSIVYGGNVFLMKQESKTIFSYQFKNINNSIDMKFEAETYTSKPYSIQVLPSPTVLDFKVIIQPPAYTGEEHSILNNVGDCNVPYGSVIKWQFNTANIDSLHFEFNDSLQYKAQRDSFGFHYRKQMFKSSNYSLTVANRYFRESDIVKYNINVIPDLHPSISVQSLRDSSNHAVFYYHGVINDDYGFQRLTFSYKPVEDDADSREENIENFQTIEIPLNKNIATQEYFHVFDFSTIEMDDKNQVNYFFTVWDNDKLNGYKSARTRTMSFRKPTKKELADMEAETGRSMEKKITEGMTLAEQLQKQINELQKSTIDKNTTPWERSQMIKDIEEKQNRLEQLMKELSKENKEKNNAVNSFSEQQKEILEKQKQIEELLENIMDEEMQKLLDEIKKLQEEMDKKDMNKNAEDLKLSYEDLSKQLDRNLELLKKFEIEQRLTNTAEELKDLAEKQKELSEETDKWRRSDEEEIKKKQKEQKEEFDELKKEYDDVNELNKELENPMNLEQFQEEMQKIQQEFENTEQMLNEKKMNKAGKSQEQNAKNLDELAKKMQEMLDAMFMEQTMENIDDLRQILDNLVLFSFEQEKLMEDIGKINRRDPKFVELMNEQKKLSDDFTIIKDSLYSLAKRTPQVKPIIGKEVLKIEKELPKALEYMNERRISSARARQQFVMTSANNLALLLSEVLDAMQNQMANSMPGKGKQKQKGKGNMPSFSDLKKQQQSLKSQLENMLKQMKEQSGKGKQGMSKELSKSLAQHEIMQKMLEDLQTGGTIHPETQKKLNHIKQMLEQSKNDIINRNVTQRTINRQEQILTRLLEAEKSENERETEKKRESTEADQKRYSNPADIFEKQKEKDAFKENLNMTNIQLYNFYKKKYKDYLMKLNSE